MFENKVYEGIHYSRFVASWTKKGGMMSYRFRKWLEHLTINGKKIPEEIVQEIYNYGTDGKLELEIDAFNYEMYLLTLEELNDEEKKELELE